MESFGDNHKGYLALPASGTGPGLLLLHPWWGLTDLFKGLADQLAAEGFVVFAPDFFDGASTADIAQAEKQVKSGEGNFPAMRALAIDATSFLKDHPAVTSSHLSAVGFSFGAAYALLLAEELPAAFDKVVLYYGMAGADVSASPARFLAHFADNDPYESVEEARKMKAPNLEVHVYPNTGHWFFESNRPDAYNAEAAKLSLERTLAFLKS
jgi:carboxymethylenebutenolidase